MVNIQKSIPNVLTIAGSDPCAGAGIQADIKTISACGCYAVSVITALTAQNTRGVSHIHRFPVSIVWKQLKALADDTRINAVKIGMLPDTAIVENIVKAIDQFSLGNIVLDPVMVSSSGKPLIDPAALVALKSSLAPKATLITPNLDEANILLKETIHKEKLGHYTQKLAMTLGTSVLLKGGHLAGNTTTDTLFDIGTETLYSFKSERIKTKNLHGTGCTLSSSIASYLASGHPLPEAVGLAKEYIQQAIVHARHLNAGSGNGPLHHFWKQDF